MSRSESFAFGGGRPVPLAASGAAAYSASRGIKRTTQDFSKVKADPVIAKHVAGLYEAAPSFDERALPSYKAMREETGRQFDFMTSATSKGGMGMTVAVTKKDPYVTSSGAPNSLAMLRDVHENRNINVLSTKSTGKHPFFSDDENDMFRAVHDVFGHAGTGRNFSADGEEAAWRAHRQMYSPLARGAMTTETRGQNSANNFGSVGGFPEQKVALLGRGAQAVRRPRLSAAQFGASI